MSWLPEWVTVISQFAMRRGVLVTVIAGGMASVIVGLPKFFENLPEIIESIYRRRANILRVKKEIKTAKAEGKVNRIRAITDRKASRMRLREQSRLLRKIEVAGTDDAVKLIQAIHTDPDLPEKRRLPDNVLGEIYTEGKGNRAGTPPGSGSPGNVRRLRKSGPP